jgi:hypothetical protein
MSPILIVVFSEFSQIEKLRQFLSSEHELHISSPCNSTNKSELGVLTTNIKIFTNGNIEGAYALANMRGLCQTSYRPIILYQSNN